MIIVDTNVISEIMRRLPDAYVSAWFDAQSRTDLFTTAITEAEILNGIEMMPRGRRCTELLELAKKIFERGFAGRIASFDSSAARSFAHIFASRKQQGRPISTLNAQIAAITHSRGAALATRNTQDFEDCGVRILNPWRAS